MLNRRALRRRSCCWVDTPSASTPLAIFPSTRLRTCARHQAAGGKSLQAQVLRSMCRSCCPSHHSCLARPLPRRRLLCSCCLCLCFRCHHAYGRQSYLRPDRIFSGQRLAAHLRAPRIPEAARRSYSACLGGALRISPAVAASPPGPISSSRYPEGLTGCTAATLVAQQALADPWCCRWGSRPHQTRTCATVTQALHNQRQPVRRSIRPPARW